MMQRILRGELPCLNLRIDLKSIPYSYGQDFYLRVEFGWAWFHYDETHGLPRTPWYNAALNDVVF